MKKSIGLLAVLSLLPLAMSAQDSLSTIQKENLPKKQKCDINYFTMYAGLSTTTSAHIESIFYKNWGVGVSVGTRASLTKNVPQPFDAGWFGDGKVYNYLYSTNISVIKKFPVSPRARFGADLGASFISYETPTFEYYKSTGYFSLSDNGYRVKDYNVQKSTGLQARVSFDWLLTPYTGIELSVLGNLNQHQSFLSPNIKFVTGFLRKKIKTVNKPAPETSQNNEKNKENFMYFDLGVGGVGGRSGSTFHLSANYRHNSKHLYSIGASTRNDKEFLSNRVDVTNNFFVMYGRAFTYKKLLFSASTGVGVSETKLSKTYPETGVAQTQEAFMPIHLQATYLFTQNVGIGAFVTPNIHFKSNSYTALGVNMHFGLLRK